MSVLVLRHEPFEHLGYFTAILDERSIGYEYRDLDSPLDVAALDRATGLIVMGGPMSANDPLAGLAAEIRVINAAIERGTPVLGICLGAQLIAKAMGASVYRNPSTEIGWGAVHLTEVGRADPIFGGLADPSVFFHWHGETFDLPVGAEWLAYSDLCRHQAFRFGSNVYGIQFHPEITPAMIEDWCAQPVNCGDVRGLDSLPDPRAVDSMPLARHIFERWLEFR